MVICQTIRSLLGIHCYSSLNLSASSSGIANIVSGARVYREKLQVSLLLPPSEYCRCLQCQYPRSKSLPTLVLCRTIIGLLHAIRILLLFSFSGCCYAVDLLARTCSCGHAPKYIPYNLAVLTLRALYAQSMPPVDITSLQSRSAEDCRAPMLKKKGHWTPINYTSGSRKAENAACSVEWRSR